MKAGFICKWSGLRLWLSHNAISALVKLLCGHAGSSLLPPTVSHAPLFYATSSVHCHVHVVMNTLRPNWSCIIHTLAASLTCSQPLLNLWPGATAMLLKGMLCFWLKSKYPQKLHLSRNLGVHLRRVLNSIECVPPPEDEDRWTADLFITATLFPLQTICSQGSSTYQQNEITLPCTDKSPLSVFQRWPGT